MLRPVRQDDERRFQILRIAARLLLGIVRIEIGALRFQHAQHPPDLIHQHIVGALAAGMHLKPHLVRIEQIPAAGFQGFVNEDAGEGFGSGGQGGSFDQGFAER